MSFTIKVTEDSPKMIRESLCLAQSCIEITSIDNGRDRLAHISRLQRLIDECDRHRPLDASGVHGDLHTATCGCDDTNGY